MRGFFEAFLTLTEHTGITFNQYYGILLKFKNRKQKIPGHILSETFTRFNNLSESEIILIATGAKFHDEKDRVLFLERFFSYFGNGAHFISVLNAFHQLAIVKSNFKFNESAIKREPVPEGKIYVKDGTAIRIAIERLQREFFTEATHKIIENFLESEMEFSFDRLDLDSSKVADLKRMEILSSEKDLKRYEAIADLYGNLIVNGTSKVTDVWVRFLNYYGPWGTNEYIKIFRKAISATYKNERFKDDAKNKLCEAFVQDPDMLELSKVLKVDEVGCSGIVTIVDECKKNRKFETILGTWIEQLKADRSLYDMGVPILASIAGKSRAFRKPYSKILLEILKLKENRWEDDKVEEVLEDDDLEVFFEMIINSNKWKKTPYLDGEKFLLARFKAEKLKILARNFVLKIEDPAKLKTYQKKNRPLRYFKINARPEQIFNDQVIDRLQELQNSP